MLLPDYSDTLTIMAALSRSELRHMHTEAKEDWPLESRSPEMNPGLVIPEAWSDILFCTDFCTTRSRDFLLPNRP